MAHIPRPIVVPPPWDSGPPTASHCTPQNHTPPGVPTKTEMSSPLRANTDILEKTHSNVDQMPMDEEITTVSTNTAMSSVPSSVEALVCRRIDNQVCICDTCETTRIRMLHRANKKRPIEETSSHPTEDDTKLALLAEQKSRANLTKMTEACQTILECIGEDPAREGLVKTPERWAKALLFMCSGYQMNPEQVTNGAVFQENHDEMVVVRNIDIHSLCEHHMVPFTGRVHIGYIPNGKILGLSKLARISEIFARRLQVQERLTRQIADAIVEIVEPLGVAVVVECTHFCMVMRGVQKTAAVTTTSSVRGCFESNPKTRGEFFSIIHGNGIKMC